jgi:membrane protein YqaA with SNARE-associated domain
MQAWINTLSTIALPEFGLSTVFVVSFISATCCLHGFRAPVVLGLVNQLPELFWAAIAVATVE